MAILLEFFGYFVEILLEFFRYFVEILSEFFENSLGVLGYLDMKGIDAFVKILSKRRGGGQEI